MRVLLDATARALGRGGTAVYVERIAAALRDEGVEVVEAVNEARGAPGTGSVRNWAADVRWVQSELPARAADADADVLHHPLPALARRCAVPQVVTVHDLAFVALPEAFDARFGAWARRAHRAAARGAAAVIVPSEATAAEARFWWDVEPVVAPHGPGQALPVRERTEPPRHFLYVGDHEPRKDLATLSAVAAELPLPLVEAGGGVAAEELAALYADAAALLHPSLHEGFGLTVLEAMRAGTPVIAADAPAVVEVAGGAARLFRRGDGAALAAAARDVAGDPTLREALGVAGRDRARAFSWKHAARRHIDAYTLAAG